MSESKVLHIRLPDWVVVGCIDLIEDRKSVVDAVRRSLEGFIRAMQRRGDVPTYSQAELDEKLNYYKLRELPELQLDIGEFRDAIRAVATTPARSIADIAEEAERLIQGDSTPRVGRKLEIDESPDTEVQDKAVIDLHDIERRPFGELKEEAPKDRLIEYVTALAQENEKASEIYKTALEIVYSNLPKSEWGGERAQKLIKDLLGMHRDG